MALAWFRFIMLFMVSSGWHSLFTEHHAGPVDNKLTHIQSSYKIFQNITLETERKFVPK